MAASSDASTVSTAKRGEIDTVILAPRPGAENVQIRCALTPSNTMQGSDARSDGVDGAPWLCRNSGLALQRAGPRRHGSP